MAWSQRWKCNAKAVVFSQLKNSYHEKRARRLENEELRNDESIVFNEVDVVLDLNR
jgi:hypothetical protein